MDEAQVKIEELATVLNKLLTALGKDVAERYSLAGDSTSTPPRYFVTALAWLILDESASQMDSTAVDVVLTCARLRAMLVQPDRDR